MTESPEDRLTSQNDEELELGTDGYMLRFPQGCYADLDGLASTVRVLRDAVTVCRWDDQAKDPAVTPPRFAHFAPLLEALVRM